jgi:membrane-associated phospholipid phosphatase
MGVTVGMGVTVESVVTEASTPALAAIAAPALPKTPTMTSAITACDFICEPYGPLVPVTPGKTPRNVKEGSSDRRTLAPTGTRTSKTEVALTAWLQPFPAGIVKACAHACLVGTDTPSTNHARDTAPNKTPVRGDPDGGDPVTTIDLSVDRALSRAQVVPLTDIAAAIYKLFSPTGAITLTIVATLIIWAASRNWRSALTFAVVVAASWLSSDIVKILVHRPRPSAAALAHPYLPTPPDASFPSGHVVFAASIAIALIYLARSTARVALVIVLGVVGTAVVAVAVVYIGVHYPTDVIASILWSVGASTLVLALWNHFVVPRLHPTPPPRMPAT